MPINPRNIELADPEVIESLKQMTPGESLQQALAAHEFGRQLVEAGVRGDHADWSDRQVQIEIVRRMHGDAIAALVESD